MLKQHEAINCEIDAIEEIITKDKKRNAQFNALVQEMYETMLNLHDETIIAGYSRMLEKLYNDKLTVNEAEKILEAEFSSFGNAAGNSMASWTGDLYHLGIDEVAAQVNIKLTYNVFDKRAISILQNQNMFWIGEYYNEHSKSIVGNELRKIFVEGASRETIADNLLTMLGDETKRGKAYFDAFTEHTASRLRNMGITSGYEEAEIEYAEVVAIIDDRTTPICREMNRRLIPVQRMTKIRDDILAVETDGKTAEEVRDQMKSIVPFWDQEMTKSIVGQTTEKILDAHPGLSLPPYHWRCRTQTVAHFEDEA